MVMEDLRFSKIFTFSGNWCVPDHHGADAGKNKRALLSSFPSSHSRGSSRESHGPGCTGRTQTASWTIVAISQTHPTTLIATTTNSRPLGHAFNRFPLFVNHEQFQARGDRRRKR